MIIDIIPTKGLGASHIRPIYDRFMELQEKHATEIQRLMEGEETRSAGKRVGLECIYRSNRDVTHVRIKAWTDSEVHADILQALLEGLLHQATEDTRP